MSRQRPIDFDHRARFELIRKLEELAEAVEGSNSNFQSQLNNLQAEHKQRTKLMKQQIHQLRQMVKRLRYPAPWWQAPVRAVYFLVQHLQREEVDAGEGAPNSVQNSAAACQKLTLGDGVEG